jgi:hypothetical protein
LANASSALAWGESCTRDLPSDVFRFFKQKPSLASCGDYEYKKVDLNDDQTPEILVTNYLQSCDNTGICQFEVFQQAKPSWRHVGSIPGRIRVMETKTNGYRDLSSWVLGRKMVFIWTGEQYEDLMLHLDRPPPSIAPLAPAPTPPPKTETPPDPK